MRKRCQGTVPKLVEPIEPGASAQLPNYTHDDLDRVSTDLLICILGPLEYQGKVSVVRSKSAA